MKKRCRKCGKIWRIKDFYKTNQYIRNTCKKCYNKNRGEWLKKHPEIRKIHREIDKKYQAKKRLLDPESKLVESQRWRKNNPMGAVAHKKIYYLLKIGKIKKDKCFLCGEPGDHAHHEDYSNPMNIIWLCCSCHKRYHLGLVNLKNNG